MKNIFPILIIVLLIISGFRVVALDTEIKERLNYFSENSLFQEEFSHTVFVEVASSQACPGCADWNTALYDIYDSGNYDFKYVSMVYFGTGGYNDILNTKAYEWKNLYDISVTPTSILDGDYRRITGSSINQFLTKFQECAERSVKDIESSMIVSWLGNATIKIDIEIENNEQTQYNGYIRLPIIEIISRYKTKSGNNYHFGFLDYALPINTDISIPSGGIYTKSITWNGNEHQDNHGTNFGDITQENIQVILGVFNSDNDFVDETLARKIGENQPPYKPTISGPTFGEPGEEYTYTFVTTDPENDNVSYFIDWNDGNIQGWLGPYLSNQEIQLSHIFDEDGFYEIRAKAIDENGAESYWSNSFIVIIGNIAPDTPKIIGPSTGSTGIDYDYTFITNDRNGDNFYYSDIDWGDGTHTGLLGPYNSGEEVTLNHIWSKKGTYTIKAKAKDIFGAESNWGEIDISIPRNKLKLNSIYLNFTDILTNAFPILFRLFLF